jgi:hypothetical protein
MNPEEKELLERSLKLLEENNYILRKLDRRARMAMLWGFVKIIVIVIPLIIGYFFLQPYLQEAADNYNGIQELFQEYRSLPF